MSEKAPVQPKDLSWYPRVKSWSTEVPEYIDAPFVSRMVADAALGVFMQRGSVPDEPDALRNAIGAGDWKEYPKAYPAARLAIDALIPLWRIELDKSIAFVQRQRDKGSAPPKDGSKPRGRPAKAPKKPEVKPEKTPGFNPAKAEPKPNETTVTVTPTYSDNSGELSGDEGSSQEPTPFQKVEFALWGRAIRLAKLNHEPADPSTLKPHERTLKSHLKGTTGLLPIIDRLGPHAAVDVLVWVARHMPPSTSYLKVLDGLDVILSQMEHGQNWIVRNRANQGQQTPDLRGQLEADIF